jgi:hypothetical protein
MFEGEVVHGKELLRRIRSGRSVEQIEAEAWRESLVNKLRDKFGEESPEFKEYEQIRQDWSAAMERNAGTEITRAGDAFDRIVDLLSRISARRGNVAGPLATPGVTPNSAV